MYALAPLLFWPAALNPVNGPAARETVRSRWFGVPDTSTSASTLGPYTPAHSG
jgi:hypothetical protein